MSEQPRRVEGVGTEEAQALEREALLLQVALLEARLFAPALDVRYKAIKTNYKTNYTAIISYITIMYKVIREIVP